MHHTHACESCQDNFVKRKCFYLAFSSCGQFFFCVCGKKYIGVTLLSVVRYFMKCDDQLSTDGNASDVDKGQTGYHHLMSDLGEKVGSYI